MAAFLLLLLSVFSLSSMHSLLLLFHPEDDSTLCSLSPLSLGPLSCLHHPIPSSISGSSTTLDNDQGPHPHDNQTPSPPPCVTILLLLLFRYGMALALPLPPRPDAHPSSIIEPATRAYRHLLPLGLTIVRPSSSSSLHPLALVSPARKRITNYNNREREREEEEEGEAVQLQARLRGGDGKLDDGGRMRIRRRLG